MVQRFRQFESSNGRKKRQIIICLTANRSEEMNTDEFNLLFEKIISKPINMEDMAKLVSDFLLLKKYVG